MRVDIRHRQTPTDTNREKERDIDAQRSKGQLVSVSKRTEVWCVDP